MDSFFLVSVNDRNFASPGQRWTLTSGRALRNDLGRTIQPPADPILVPTLRMGPGSGSERFNRTFID